MTSPPTASSHKPCVASLPTWGRVDPAPVVGSGKTFDRVWADRAMKGAP